MNRNEAIRLIALVVLIVGSAFYHMYNLPESKSYSITVLNKWESESCGKHNCYDKYTIKYQVDETGYVSQMNVLKNDYMNFSTGSVASYTLSRSESHDVTILEDIVNFICLLILIVSGLFLVLLGITYVIIILGSIVNWKFNIEDFKFWNWEVI